MGDLIVMSRARPVPAREQMASAEILFFTGVRYYRMPDEVGPLPAATLVNAGARKRRRRIAVERRRRAPEVAIEALV